MKTPRIRLRTLLALATAPIALATPQMAFAQQTAVGNDEASEIIVTARRRDERLQDVPIAITAYSGVALERTGAIDITDLSNTTPNVTFENTRGTNNSLSAFIRGVGQQDPVGGFEAGVGLYLDDVYLNRPQAAVLDIYDVERIEVLRGPQGTLYGRNTIGGAVKYVTRRLADDFSLKLRGTYGSYNQADGIISVSAPIGDVIKVGGSLARLSRGGFGDNLNLPGVENYNKDVWAGRGTVELATPDDRLVMRLSGDYTRDKSDARNGHRLVPGLLTGAPVLDNVFDTRAGLALPVQDVEAYGLAMNISAELTDTLTFRSISAWRKDVSFTPIDFDSLPAADVDVPARYANEQLSQEFQLLYEGDRLNGLVGFYYLDAKAVTTFDVYLFTTVPNLNAATDGTVKTSTWSVFGDFTYDFSDQLSVSAGGRYTHDVRNASVFRQNRLGRSAIFGGTPVALGAPSTDFKGEATYTRFTPRASISYKPTADHTLYASYSRGFKGGGFDPRGNATIAPDTNRDGVRSYDEIYDFFSFDPETVDSYELGWRGSMFDRRLTVALTGFYADYKDVQIPGSVGIDANGDGVFETFAGVTTNAASAQMKGVELESTAILARDFAGDGSAVNFTGTLGFIDANYKTFIDAFGNDVADIRAIQNTPKWTVSGTLAAALPVGGGMVNGSTTLSWRSKTNQFEVPSPYLDQPGYALWDASLVWTDKSERYSVGVHAKNIADQRYITSGYQFLQVAPDGTPLLTNTGALRPSLGREGVVTAFYGNPRQVYLTVGLKF